MKTPKEQPRLKERNEKIIQQLNQNVPVEKIAARLKITRNRIYTIARRNGLFLRNKKSRVPLIKRLLKEGFSTVQIAKRLNISRQATYLVKKQMILDGELKTNPAVRINKKIKSN